MSVLFLGIDWGHRVLGVCLLDSQGKVLWRRLVSNRQAALDELITSVRGIAPPERVLVAIETPHGLVVDQLLEAGFSVVALPANILRGWRSRHGPAKGKDDLADAYMLADGLRTDHHRFHPLRPDSEATQVIRCLSGMRRTLVSKRLSARNELEALLRVQLPGVIGLFHDLTSPTSLAFLERFPTQERADWLSPARLAKWLTKQSYTGRKSPERLMDHLQEALRGTTGARADVQAGQVGHLVAQIRLLREQIGEVEKQLSEAVQKHEDAPLFASLPMTGDVLIAGLISVFGDDRDRFSDSDAVAGLNGVAPVTYASGRRRVVRYRRACHRTGRWVLTCFAGLSVRQSPWAQESYDAARARGMTHPKATRSLARKWVRILYSMWKNRTPYDPSLKEKAPVRTAA